MAKEGEGACTHTHYVMFPDDYAKKGFKVRLDITDAWRSLCQVAAVMSSYNRLQPLTTGLQAFADCNSLQVPFKARLQGDCKQTCTIRYAAYRRLLACSVLAD